jgi:hypothetical protein
LAIVRTVVGWLADRSMPAVGLYAVAMCFIGALVIVDACRAERQVTQLLSIEMVAVGLLLASLLNDRAVLLVLIFASSWCGSAACARVSSHWCSP